MQISKTEARRFLLAYQNLLSPVSLQGKSGILAHFCRVGCIQFDPLNIVGHNPDLVLQARVRDFQPQMLRELLYKDRKLLDGWDKVTSIYCVEDWPYFRRGREAAKRRRGKNAEAIHSVLPQVRAAIEERGPLSSADLDLGEMVDWDWAQSRLARAVLDSMYSWGELVVHHKVHTRKFYDFARRCLPQELLQAADPNETEEQYQDWQVQRRIGSVGLLWNRSGDVWLGMHSRKNRYSLTSQERRAALERLIHGGKVVSVQVEGIKEPFYLRSQELAYLDQARRMDEPARAVVMAPLDNLLWDRRMLREIFDFDYKWEVYIPVDKRRYGYYVLPVLYGDRFIARFEPGYEKQQGILTIKGWWWEDGVAPSQQMRTDLADCFRRFLRYLDAKCLQIDPQPLGRASLGWLAAQF
ncbi:MAG: winged helix DNA-binding domain-containing protein [Anaerolineae bacterium]|nr:winged helix DNA-binding domain-containing protein [Anaerolineae bacterium]